jgi:hypothetical protein
MFYFPELAFILQGTAQLLIIQNHHMLIQYWFAPTNQSPIPQILYTRNNKVNLSRRIHSRYVCLFPFLLPGFPNQKHEFYNLRI